MTMLLGAKLTREPKPDTLTHHCKILCRCVYGEWRRKSENHCLTAPSFSLVAIQTHGTQCWPCIMHSVNTGLTVALPQQIFSFVSPNSRLGLIGCPLSVTSRLSHQVSKGALQCSPRNRSGADQHQSFALNGHCIFILPCPNHTSRQVLASAAITC